MTPDEPSNDNTADNMSATAEIQEPLDKSNVELPKAWDAEDPYQFAPPKPDEDPWTLLVEPLLRKDKIQCDAWKDEVQNLLIFAGLFSAIATAFIMESYKTLLPDPDDAIVSLLSQIATRLDGPLNVSTPASLPATQSPFVPKASAVRVNTFWFLSLVLSLATVLTGIISLQWLREHLVYTDLSPREKYAMYHMRAEGFKKWHVGKIFTTMPVLLQCALVLFLGGIIDFLHAIGYWDVTIPVTVVVGLTLLFLVATTLLPCLQLVSLYFHSSTSKSRSPLPKRPPSQCPYRSPQSHAILAIFCLSQSIGTCLCSYFQKFIAAIKVIVRHSKPDSISFGPPADSFTRYLRQAYQGTPWWIDTDEAWLNIRDAYMRRALGKELFPQQSYSRRNEDLPPVYDIVDGLLSQSWQKSSAIPAYYCFDEISKLVNFYDSYHQGVYLHGLLSNEESLQWDISLYEFLGIDTFDESLPGSDLSVTPNVVEQQNTFLFLRFQDMLFPEVEVLAAHRRGLGLGLIKYFLKRLSVYPCIPKPPRFPSCLSFDTLNVISRSISIDENYLLLRYQFGDTTLSLLRHIYDTDTAPPNILMLEEYLAGLLTIAAYSTRQLWYWKAYSVPIKIAESLQSANERVYESICAFLDKKLTVELSGLPLDEGSPCSLFYMAAIYCYFMTPRALSLYPSTSSLRSTVLKYKNKTIDKGMVDRRMEIRIRASCHEVNSREDMQISCRPFFLIFSAEFWNEIERDA